MIDPLTSRDPITLPKLLQRYGFYMELGEHSTHDRFCMILAPLDYMGDLWSVMNLEHGPSNLGRRGGAFDRDSAPVLVRRTPCKTPPCTLMHQACKIHRECNVLQVPFQILHLGIQHKKQRGAILSVADQNCNDMSPDMSLRDESKTVSNNPLRCSNPTLNTTYLPTYLPISNPKLCRLCYYGAICIGVRLPVFMINK